jgi:hypothetical protein
VRPSLPLLVAALLCGCAARADRVFSAPGILTGSSGARPGYAVKRVEAKEAPADVVGDDGSVCRLTAERFTKVDVGDWIGCDWTLEVDTAATIARQS